jgi:hypothetical protein
METAWLNAEIEYAMLLCYGDVWNDGYDELKRHVSRPSASMCDEKYGKFMARTVDIDLSIQLDCVPLLTGEQAKELWRDGFMTKDDVAQILQGQYLIPQELVHVLAMPDRDPQITMAQEAQRAKAKAKPKVKAAPTPADAEKNRQVN